MAKKGQPGPGSCGLFPQIQDVCMCFPPQCSSQWSLWGTDPFENMIEATDTPGKVTLRCMYVEVSAQPPRTPRESFLSFPGDKDPGAALEIWDTQRQETKTPGETLWFGLSTCFSTVWRWPQSSKGCWAPRGSTVLSEEES